MLSGNRPFESILYGGAQLRGADARVAAASNRMVNSQVAKQERRNRSPNRFISHGLTCPYRPLQSVAPGDFCIPTGRRRTAMAMLSRYVRWSVSLLLMLLTLGSPLSSSAAGYDRQDVTFTSQGLKCAAW